MRRITSILALVLLTAQAVLAAPANGPRPELLIQNGHVFQICSVAFSPDGARIATGSKDGTVKLWETAGGRMITTLHPKVDISSNEAGVNFLAFSPDGRTLYSCSYGPCMQTWDAQTGKLLGEIKLPTTRYVVPFVLSRDGRTMYLGADKTVDVFDLAARKKIGMLPDSDIWTTSLALSGDGRTLVAGGSHGEVRAWDVVTKTLKAKAGASHSMEVSVAVSADGRTAAFNCGTAETLDLASGKRVQITQPSHSHAQVALSGDGKQMVVTGEQTQVFDVASGKEIVQLPTPFGSTAIAFTSDGKLLAVGDNSGQTQLYAAGASPQLSVSLVGHAQAVTGVAFTQRGQRMVTTGYDRTVKVWDTMAGRPISVIQLPWDGVLNHRSTVLAASPDGKVVASGSWDGAVDVYDVDSGKKLWTSNIGGERYRHHVSAMAFSRDGRVVAVGNIGGNLGVWDVPSGKLKFAENVGTDVTVSSLGISADGRTLAVGRGDGHVDQWDISHFKMARIVTREVWAPSSRYAGVGAVAFSPDGRRLAASTWYGNVYVWDTESEKEPVRLGPGGNVKVGSSQKGNSTSVSVDLAPDRQSGLISAAFSPDARSLATGAVDGTLTLWDISTGQVRARVRGDDSLPLNDVAFSFDGRVVATAGADGSLRFWDGASGKLLASAVELDRGKDWAVTTPDGLFDGSSGGQRLMEWRIGDRLFALDQFFNDYYTPGLLGRIVNPPRTGAATTLAPARSLATLPAPPRVEITSPASGERVTSDTLAVKVKLTDQGGGSSNPRLFLNGHRLPDASRNADGSWQVKLTGGVNRLRATAYNKEGNVESRGDEIRVQCDAVVSTRPVLHVVAVGVDKYQNGLSLNFARADAEAIAKFFKPGLFGEVDAHLLIDDKANKQAILDTLKQVAKTAAPQDAVVLYLAGHGTLVGEVFYYLPYDAKVGSEDDIRRSGLSSVDIGEGLTSIAATKQLLILDACHSGASATSVGRMLSNRDSIAEVRAVQRLSRSSGSFLIAASKAEQYAKEIPELGHGVLTYAILTALGEKSGPAALANGDGQVTVNALLRYLDDEVPKLTEKYQRGDRQEIVQASTGQDFPLVIVIRK